jgi:hypothetical protein
MCLEFAAGAWQVSVLEIRSVIGSVSAVAEEGHREVAAGGAKDVDHVALTADHRSRIALVSKSL